MAIHPIAAKAERRRSHEARMRLSLALHLSVFCSPAEHKVQARTVEPRSSPKRNMDQQGALWRWERGPGHSGAHPQLGLGQGQRPYRLPASKRRRHVPPTQRLPFTPTAPTHRTPSLAFHTDADVALPPLTAEMLASLLEPARRLWQVQHNGAPEQEGVLSCAESSIQSCSACTWVLQTCLSGSALDDAQPALAWPPQCSGQQPSPPAC